MVPGSKETKKKETGLRPTHACFYMKNILLIHQFMDHDEA
jgi:hypothetical protein